MMREYGYDVIDGQKVPQLVVTKDHVIQGVHQGTVNVEAGTLYLRGTLQGTLDVQNGTSVEVTGEQQGTVTIATGAKVTVTGSIQGTTTVGPNASLVIEASGKLAGTLCNNGLVILRGVFGGVRSGDGRLCIKGNGGRFKLQMHHFEQQQRPQWVSDSRGIFGAGCLVARQLS